MDDRERLAAMLAAMEGPGGASLASGERVELDSLQLLEVITLVEKEFGMDFGDQDVDPDDFRTLDALVGLVARRRAA